MSKSKKNRGLGRGLSALMNDLTLTEHETPVEGTDADDTSSSPNDRSHMEAPIKTSDGPVSRETSKAKSERQIQIEALERQLVDDRSEPKSAQPQQQPEKSTPDATPNSADGSLTDIRTIAIDRLIQNPHQPRKVFDKTKLEDLVNSIQERGVLQPILVRPIADVTEDGVANRYQIVAGERRWQAALKAGLSAVPIISRDLSDRDVLEIGVIKNVQRADLNPLEEAMAYEQLIAEFNRTQADIAKSIGKSRAHVANTIRLLGLSERGRDMLLAGKITAGHARAVLAADEPDALVEAIIDNNLSVRDAEKWAKSDAQSTPLETKSAKTKTADILALEKSIADQTGFLVDIRHKAKGGEVKIKYRDLAEMDRLLEQLKKS